MAILEVGKRLYVTGNTYAIKDQLKSIGCHWDADRKQWWIGKAKQADLQKIVDGNSGASQSSGGYVAPTAEELSQKPCSGQVEYKGRKYYVVGQSSKTSKLLLTVLDCSISFWAAQSDCRWVKRYEARERTYNYGRYTETVHQTVGGIRKFIERSKHDRSDQSSSPSTDHSWRGNGCLQCRQLGDWCPQCAFDEFDN